MTQYDLPPQAHLQQSAARARSGEELETFGKYASAAYRRGAHGTLNEAVVETVKKAGLSPEQVRRVCEFANTDAFISEFRKEGSASKYVSFAGGPAVFSEVLKDLNDGGGGTVFDDGSSDYEMPPIDVKLSSVLATPGEKVASAQVSDDVLERAFDVGELAAQLPFHNPLGDVEDMQSKLATIRDSAVAEISELETLMLEVTEEMYGHVKQAAMDGVPLGHIVQAWDQALEPDAALVKMAFAHIGPRLTEEGIFSWDSMGASLEKTAGVHAVVDSTHPLVSSFGAYREVLEKLAVARATQLEADAGLEQLHQFTVSVSQHYPEQVR